MAQAFAALGTGAPLDFDAIRVVSDMPLKTCSIGHARSGTQRRDSLRPQAAPEPTRAAGRDRLAAAAVTSPGERPAAGAAHQTAHHGPGEAGPPPRLATAAATVPDDERAPQTASPELAALQARNWAGSGWRDEPRSRREQARAAAELVARARRGRLPTLRLRGLRREPALVALAAFVARERAARSRYVRVVTGKGLGSPGDPVLKEAVAEWCASAAGEAEVSAWAPELDVRGEYGSVILQLRPPD